MIVLLLENFYGVKGCLEIVYFKFLVVVDFVYIIDGM